MDAEDCYRHCLHNCSYLAFSYIRGIGCLIWNQELMDVTQFYVGGELLSNRLARYELGKSNHKKTIYVVVVSLSFFVILGSSVFGFCRNKVKRNASKSKDVSKDAWRNGLKPQDVPGLNFFEIKSIETATNDFSLSNKLGQGEAARWKRNCLDFFGDSVLEEDQVLVEGRVSTSLKEISFELTIRGRYEEDAIDRYTSSAVDRYRRKVSTSEDYDRSMYILSGPLGRYVATELEPKLGRYVATERPFRSLAT
ncbi:hypothetical protein F2Q69_00013575 [Brassica cretica]|uniref:Apple domain-containing protein n=1 Tax=Brassica cretica TaxID=69181 RepID=A0A8S9R2T6_BRACR|nr:hypothetical protein F2Q69_00013575 [Brassica cretica]